MPNEIAVRVLGDEEAERALRRLPDVADDAVEDALVDTVNQLGDKVRRAARGDRAPQTRLLEPTINVDLSGEPSITVGGSRAVVRDVPAYKLVFGSEYGSNRYPAFQRPFNRAGYWFNPVFDTSREIDREVDEAADDVVRAFQRGR